MFNFNMIRILTIFILIFLLFTPTVFAGSVEALAAIKNNKPLELKKELDGGFDPNLLDINALEEFLPSIEVSQLLLKNDRKTIGPSKFLHWIMRYRAEDHAESIERQKKLVVLGLDYGARASELLEMATNLLALYDGGNRGRRIIITESCQIDLLNLALDKGAKFQDIKLYPFVLPSPKVFSLILNSLQNYNDLLEWVIENKHINQDDSVEAMKSQFMLVGLLLDRNQGLDNTKLVGLISRLKVAEYDPQTGVASVNQDLVKRKEELIEMVVNKNGAKTIDYHMGDCVLPSVKLSTLLMQKGYDPTKFLKDVFSVRALDYDNRFINQQEELVKLALQYPVDKKQIKNPEILEAVDRHMPFVGRNQKLLQKQLALIFNKYVPLNQAKLLDHLKTNEGYCSGLTHFYGYTQCGFNLLIQINLVTLIMSGIKKQ